MKSYILVGLLVLLVQKSVAPPVKEQKKEETNEIDDKEDLEGVVEYQRYLNEVVQALENDPEFRAKLEKADETDIRSGKIAEELKFVSHHVRTKLDELKRQELNRLRQIAMENYRKEIGISPDHMDHLNHKNPHTFEVDDLKKLIDQTTKNLNEADRKRREQFKEYEMNKHYEIEESLKGNNDFPQNAGLSEEERKAKEKEIHDMDEKHKQHEPLHHPGSKQQLEEVWVKQDHMESQDFDPKTFFYMHDLDGNGVWDQNELKALFNKELDKLYQEGHPEDDLREREEEMERMREHVFNEADVNKDGLISLNEFLDQSRRPDFQQDEGWDSLDKQQIYSQEEYDVYRQKKISQGMQHPPYPEHPQDMHQQFPSHPDMNQGQYHQGVPPPPQYQQHPAQGQIPQQQQYHGQVPPQYHAQPGHDQQYQQQQYHQQPPPYQGVPQQQYQVPAQQNQQIPAQQQQYQVPAQQQPQVPAQQHQQAPAQQHPQVPAQQQPQVPAQQHQQAPAQQHPQVPPQQYQQQAPIQQQQPVPSHQAKQPGVATNAIHNVEAKPADHKPIPHVPVPQANQHPPMHQPAHGNEPQAVQV